MTYWCIHCSDYTEEYENSYHCEKVEKVEGKDCLRIYIEMICKTCYFTKTRIIVSK